MYAVFRTGNRQYRAEVGTVLDVEKLPLNVNDTLDINDVLLISNGDDTRIGTPRVEGASVRATVVDQFRGKKIIVFKYRQRTTLRVKRGHRQYYTRLRIDAINA